ncbi:helix-turn-helix domain-containing protein [Sphaerisporangium sp. NPDC088356]|uniref:helix-turn-helix domain-containing protein n=1 Tax=Sphaerisporangium sp. NPDC088356 TaxID=3154871 RepID=UPI00342C38C1
MPRPERPLDPSEGPVQQFATELRKLREEAGNPSYRELAGIAHFSKATLSAAASGHRLPTWEVARAYVQACNGDLDEWRIRWRKAREQLGLGNEEESEALLEHDVDDVELKDAEPTPGRAVSLTKAAIAVGFVGVAALGAWASLSDAPPTSSPGTPTVTGGPVSTPTASLGRFIGGKEPVEDNHDPKKTGCAYDPQVTTIDRVEVNTADEHYLGELELRHSPQCKMAWGRFTPSSAMTYIGNARVRITAIRPATNTTGLAYQTDFDGQAVFGNILSEQSGCVMIMVVVTADKARGSAATDCRL